MSRVILHSDANCFYAAVECCYRPELKTKPVAVCGSQDDRHGIVLTANYPAKRMGVKTGMAIWQARDVCPKLVDIKPDYEKYLYFSRLMREIYEEYSDKVESFGLDECWIDYSGNQRTLEDGIKAAQEIRKRIRFELGITVSIGVSFNKIFAKLGSDMKKPDAMTVIPKESFKKIVWPLPVADLLYVGRKTNQKLYQLRVETIGDLANCDTSLLQSKLGKVGIMLQEYAAGRDYSPVMEVGYKQAVKSIGNSTTTPHDVGNYEDLKCVVYLLSESVAMRLREHGFRACCIKISVRSTDLLWFSTQHKISEGTCLTGVIAKEALRLFRGRYSSKFPFRSIGVHCSDLIPNESPVQLSFFNTEEERQRHEKVEKSIDELRKRFGTQIVERGVIYSNKGFQKINPKDTHIIHPVQIFKG